ncbi:SH3 domain-binding glutamic acid-rich-like protein 3 [Mustelus asterias]
MEVIVYYTSITATSALEKRQSSIRDMLTSLKIPHKLVDLSQDETLLGEMRKKTGNPEALPPQVFYGDQYCGDYAAFDDAMESEKVEEFFKAERQQKK